MTIPREAKWAAIAASDAERAKCFTDWQDKPFPAHFIRSEVVKRLLSDYAAVRAEERAAQASRRNEETFAGEPLDPYASRATIAAQATQIAALRAVVLSIEPRHAKVSRDSNLSWVEWNVLRDAALEMSGGVAKRPHPS